MTIASYFALVMTFLAVFVFLVARRLANRGSFQLMASTGVLFTFCDVVAFADLPASWVVAAACARSGAALLHCTAWLRHTRTQLAIAPGTSEVWFERLLWAVALLAIVPGMAYSEPLALHPVHLQGLQYRVPTQGLVGVVANVLGLATLGLVLSRFLAAFRQRVRYSGLHLLALSILALAALHDSVVRWFHLGFPFLLDASVLGPITILTYWYVSAFAETRRELDTLLRHVEGLLDERTQELARAAEELQGAKKLEALGQMAASVAHEVNNPAAAVAANLSYLSEQLSLDPHATNEMKVTVAESITSIRRISAIVRTLLDSARGTARQQARLAAVSLAPVASEAARMARARVGQTPHVCLNIPADLVVLADEQLLVQVLANLIVNGLQAIPPGREQGRVVVEARRTRAGVHLLVEDDGVGMSQETLGRLFTPFFTTKAERGGTGLGLSTARGFIKDMGGTLEFESEPGRGTRAMVGLADGARAVGRVRLSRAGRRAGREGAAAFRWLDKPVR